MRIVLIRAHPMHDTDPDPRDARRRPADDTRRAPRTIDSSALFRAGPVVHIDHRGQRYVLRVTRDDKLILTK